jgi:putative oxidoreductase
VTARWAILTGRLLIAMLFVAGAVQKAVAPEAAGQLLTDRGLPEWLVWPALAFNAAGAFCLVSGLWLGPVALLLALYCMATSVCHFIPEDPWQMSIFVKNWAISGGLLILFGLQYESDR